VARYPRVVPIAEANQVTGVQPSSEVTFPAVFDMVYGHAGIPALLAIVTYALAVWIQAAQDL
jgi:hypothetical protein